MSNAAAAAATTAAAAGESDSDLLEPPSPGGSAARLTAGGAARLDVAEPAEQEIFSQSRRARALTNSAGTGTGTGTGTGGGGGTGGGERDAAEVVRVGGAVVEPPSTSTTATATTTTTATAAAQPIDAERAALLERRRAQALEDPSQPAWRTHRKHVFVLSSAGKPIYSRYGDEQKMAAFMAAMSGLVSFVDDMGDAIRSMSAGRHQFVFLVKGPIYLAIVADTGEATSQLALQLEYVHAQIISILTSGVEKIFRSKQSFDLRNLLGGADVFIDSLLRQMDHDASFFLDAVHSLRLPAAARQVVGSAIHGAEHSSLLFGMLIANMRLVHLVRPKRFVLQPLDLHLIMNFVSASSSFRTSESWTPICLPRFSANGFLHAHVCYVARDVCLVLISTSAEAFFTLAEQKNKIVASLNAHGALSIVQRASELANYSVSEAGVPGLLHFVYKSAATSQYTSPSLGAPYVHRKDRKRLFRLYQRVFARMFAAQPHHKVYYFTTDRELIVGWVTGGFELYAVFSPLENKSAAIKACNELLRFLKRDESNLFIPPVYFK